MNVLVSIWNAAKKIPARLVRAATLWLEYDGGVYSAAVAYYAALSVFPVFLITHALIQFVIDHLPAQFHLHDPILTAIEEESSPQLRAAIEQSVSGTHDFHHFGGLLGGLWLFLMALLVFAQIDRGFNRLWADRNNQPKSFFSNIIALLKNRTRAVLLLFCFGLIIACVFALSVFADTSIRMFDMPRTIPWMVHVIIHVIVHTAFFTLVFQFFTPMTVRISESLESALLLSVCWECSRLLISQVMIRDYSSLYGISGSFIVILLWIYYGTILIFYCAAYLRCLVAEREETEVQSLIE